MAAAIAALSMHAGAAQDAAPLPETEAFFAATREHFARSERAAPHFAYTERRTELHTNPFGRLGTGDVVTYRVTPTLDGQALERTLIERAGRRVEGAVPERQPIRRRPPGRRSTTEDVVSVLTFSLDRRERAQGRDLIVVRFAPRPDAEPQTRQGRIVRAFTGTLWVDEAEREVVRAEDLSYGFGVVARLSKGATVHVTRDRVDEDTWMPTSIRITGDGRAMLLRRLTIRHTIDWFDYRRVAER
jgi:hypothetical protein